ncbi:hypothetical protein RN001_005738 [Aquatica leii]|uniref:Uncharacterized protein n=1 Tax=Aquatica leii TaxID=1421715 RepID=A0AAN7SJ26_9COLE|nr:hypothetical protein RN001_005738 [Aquatica leii]
MEALHNADNCMSQVPVATTNTVNQPTIIEAINANRQSYATLKTNTFFAKKEASRRFNEPRCVTPHYNSTTVTTTNNDSITNKNSKQEKNPPIIIHSDITNHEQFLEYVQQNVPKGFEIKYTKNNVTVYVSDEKDWSNLNKTLQKDKIEYHTYTHKNQKPHAFVLRSLDHEPEPTDVKHEIEKDYGIKIKEVYRMRGTKRPAFLVITEQGIKLRPLQTQETEPEYWKKKNNRERKNKEIKFADNSVFVTTTMKCQDQLRYFNDCK